MPGRSSKKAYSGSGNRERPNASGWFLPRGIASRPCVTAPERPSSFVEIECAGVESE